MQHVVTQLQGVTIDMSQYARKRDLLCMSLAAMGTQFVTPQGGFYLFPRTPIPDDVGFVKGTPPTTYPHRPREWLWHTGLFCALPIVLKESHD